MFAKILSVVRSFETVLSDPPKDEDRGHAFNRNQDRMKKDKAIELLSRFSSSYLFRCHKFAAVVFITRTSTKKPCFVIYEVVTGESLIVTRTKFDRLRNQILASRAKSKERLPLSH